MTRVTQQHVDARRGAILDAAARVFARKGTSAATMAEIAGEADLSAGAIYRYFSSKEELLRAVFDEATVRNHEMFQTAAEQATSPLDALRQVGHRVWVEEADRDDLICDVQMALAAAQEPDEYGVDLFHTKRQIRELLTGLVQQAQAVGEIDPALDAHHLAVILEACTAGIKMLKLGPDDVDLEATFNLFVDMVTGLRPDAR